MGIKWVMYRGKKIITMQEIEEAMRTLENGKAEGLNEVLVR